jgi:hypothetical protein
MKFTPQRQLIKYENVGESLNFDVKVNAKLIAILSDGIYSDKVLAVVRELSANARDSHIENNNLNTPFDISLPTIFNQQFIIRDYGVGLSPERIKDVYCTYGESTKDTSNNFTGMLGIGSKVPFCYHTKSCTIESFYGGKHYIYSAHIGEDGIPKLVKIGENDTTEPTGVKIIIPTLQADINNFTNAAVKVFTWFDVKPNFLTNKIQIPKIEVLLKGDTNWELRKNNYGIINDAVAVMGAMHYPINFQDSNLTDQIRALMESPITVYFKLGELDIAASREGLSYDSKTKTHIINRLAKIVTELNGKVEKEVSICKTLFEARQKVGQVLSKLPSALRDCVDLNSLKFNGKEVFTKNVFDNYDLSLTFPSSVGLRRLEKTGNNNVRVTHSYSASYYKRFLLLEADCKTGNQTRAKEYFLNHYNDYNFILLVSFLSDDPKKEKAELLELLGDDGSHIISCSTLPKPAPQIRSPIGTARNTTSKIMLYQGGVRGKTYAWKSTTKDLIKDSGVWVEFNTYSFRKLNDKVHHHPRHLSAIISNLNNIGKANNSSFKEIKEVYGIKTALLSKINKKNWINLFDILEQEMEKIGQNKDFAQAVTLAGCNFELGDYNQSYYKYMPNITWWSNIAKKLDKNHVVSKMVDNINEYRDCIKKYNNIIPSFKLLNNWLDKQVTVPNIKFSKPEELTKDIYDKYQLIPFLDWNNTRVNLTNAIVDYIKKV